MKSYLRPLLNPIGIWLAVAAAAPAVAALVPTEWRYRQHLAVAAPGVIQVELSDATFDAAQPDLADLRLLDPDGKECALLLDQQPIPVASRKRPASFASRLVNGSTVLTIETGLSEPLASVLLETPHPYFMRGAKLEISPDGSSWTELDEGLPLFRQWGAEQLTLPLGEHQAAWLRISVSGSPLPFTAATLARSAGARAAPIAVGARITARDEFAQETLLTLALDGRNIPLSSLELTTPEPLFMRRVSVTVRDIRDLVASERTVGTGTIYRVALAGAPPRMQLDLPVNHTPLTGELLVHIHNGDSPPLAIAQVRLMRRPISLLFMAATPGSYTLLSGNSQASAPRYDLAAFAGDLRTAQATKMAVGAREESPGYQPRNAAADPALAEIPLVGAPLDTAAWTRQRPVLLQRPGVQELELDPTTLASARSDLADLRLMRAGNQIPYLLEQSGLARSLTLTPVAAPDPQRPAVSIWQVKLPRAGLPLLRVALATDTALFQRQFRLYEKLPASDGRSYEHTLANGAWSRTPEAGSPRSLVLSLHDRVQTDTLILETDNGDNPPIVLAGCKAEHPVIRLIFKTTETDGLILAYGQPSAAAPRYDLSLVALRLLNSERLPARLSDEELATGGSGWRSWRTLQGGPLFWVALALVVIVLLVVVARLLPKPDPTQ